MSIIQTVEVPPSHRLTIDVPPEVPAGPVTLAYLLKGAEPPKERVFGCAKGEFWMADDFDAPLEVPAEWKTMEESHAGADRRF